LTSKWEEGQNSILTIELTGDSKSCTLKLSQKNIPLEDKHGVKVFEKVQDGWKQNIFRAIKNVFNF
jgi:activator of HSP90 ATPase